jgi:hypothetical protein
MSTIHTHHPHQPQATLGGVAAVAAVIVGVAVGGIALAQSRGDTQVQAPPAHHSTTYSHHVAGPDRFHYLGTGGRVQIGE